MPNQPVKLPVSQELLTTTLRLELARLMNDISQSAKPVAKADTLHEAVLTAAKRINASQQKTVARTMSTQLAANATVAQLKLLLPNLGKSTTLAADIARVTKMPVAPVNNTAMLAATAQPVWMGGHVNFNLKSVKCIDETDGLFGSEAGEDEIYLEGFGVNPMGSLQKWKRRKPTGAKEEIEKFKVGNFEEDSKTKNVVNYSPVLNLLEFPMVNKFPATFTNTLILVESDDEGALAKEARKLIEKAIKYLDQFVKDAIAAGGNLAGVQVPQSIMSEISSWINKAVKAALEWFYDLAFGNDVFKSVIAQFTISSSAILDQVVKELDEIGKKYTSKKIDGQQLIALTKAAGDKLPREQKEVSIKGHGGTYSLSWEWNVFPGTGLG